MIQTLEAINLTLLDKIDIMYSICLSYMSL